jgi:sugar lactone lactonase YvrE
MTAQIFDDRQCELGEGPLWHPERNQLFWFDILGKKLLSRVDDTPLEWQFDDYVSAAGWIDRDNLLIASETQLFQFNLDTGEETYVCGLEVEDQGTRSNDGRADPQGGFWIGMMGKAGQKRPGAIYRYYRGELRRIFDKIAIPNAISFAPDGTTAYFTSSPDRRIMTTRLDSDGWPVGEPAVFVDLRAQGYVPDGAVVAADGTLWNARWGSFSVARHATDGTEMETFAIPGQNSTCPAFGGPDLKTLFCTTALEHLTEEQRAANPGNGMTYCVQTDTIGQAEHRVIL